MIARAALAAAVLASSALPAAALDDTACFIAIRDALARITASGPVRILMTVEDAVVGPLETRISLLPGKALSQVSAMLGTTSEAIVVDGRAWMRIGETWSELAPPHARMLMATNMSAPMTLLVGISDADCPDTADDAAFSFTAGGEGMVASTTIRLDSAGRPIRIETSLERNGKATQTTMDYEYDPTIVVTAPVL
jgi:hypothetical protein